MSQLNKRMILSLLMLHNVAHYLLDIYIGCYLTAVTQVQLKLLTKITQYPSLTIPPQNLSRLMALSIDQYPT